MKICPIIYEASQSSLHGDYEDTQISFELLHHTPGGILCSTLHLRSRGCPPTEDALLFDFTRALRKNTAMSSVIPPYDQGEPE